MYPPCKNRELTVNIGQPFFDFRQSRAGDPAHPAEDSELVEVIADALELTENGVEPINNDNLFVKGAGDEVIGHGHFGLSGLETDCVKIGLTGTESKWFFRHIFVPFSVDCRPEGRIEVGSGASAPSEQVAGV